MKILKRKTLAALLALSLLASILPLGAQPALAAENAPTTLYVGNYQITNSGTTTYLKAGSTQGSLEKGSETDWTVKYDPNSATLTLRNATINTSGNNAVIYAESNSQSAVSLTIELEGTNTIECDSALFGIYVNAEMNAFSYGTNATLTIMGDNNGSLEVSGSNHGIFVKSGTGNASLNINDASVVASSSSSYSGYAGVYVMSSMHATSSPALSLAVNGGSLTASGGDGISFNVGSSGDIGATTSLTVNNNAIVKAINGIEGYRVDKPTPSGTGIVFDDKEGTVYGDVTLDESLIIDQGETLTIGKDASLTVPEGTTLTNNGTINVKDGGKLEGETTGTVVHAPTITIQPESQTVTAGNTATFTVVATGEALSYQWQQITDNGQSWTEISGATSATYTIAATSTDMSSTQYRCVVSNSAGSVTSNAVTLTVDPVSVAGVTLNETELALYTGGSATLTAKIEPADATNQAVTWSSDKPEVATVEGGKVTAVSAGTATITVTTADGNYTDTCTVNVTEPSYSITADTTALNFGSAYTGYTQPAAQTVTVENTGNQPVILTQPSSTDNFVVGNLTDTELAAGETATFTVQPKAGLSAGTYSDTITVSGSENVIVTIPASFTVKSRPSYNPPTVSEETTDAIADAQPGETVTVDLSSGSTKLDKDVFETLAGKDVTLVVDLGDGVSWTVNGSDVPEDADFTDIDMGVTMNSDGIPANVINTITGEVGTVQITLAHDGEFGFTMTLTAPLGKENAGYWANLYHYKVNGGEADREDPLGDDEDAEALNFEAAAKIDETGSVTIPFSHASQYAIVIDTHSHATVDVSDLFIDIARDAWYKDAIQYAYDNGLMTGTSATTFEPEATTTRAMIVSILARLEGVESAEAAGFADVDDEWYATAVNWAANVGVVNGYEDNTFRPNQPITREQLAAILMNYAACIGQDVSARASLDNYTDQPSTWAEEAMQWAVAEGLISGVTADTLQPQGAATRAQVAAILQRFLSE